MAALRINSLDLGWYVSLIDLYLIQMELSEASFLEFLLHSVIDLCQLALAEEWP